MKRFLAVFVARNLEFFRDKSTFIWNLFLPAFLIFGFAFAFNGNNAVSYKVGVIGQTNSGASFMGFKYIQFIPYADLDGATAKLARHQIDMVLDFGHTNYYVNTESQQSYMVEKVLLSDTSVRLSRQVVTGKKIRYIDWFMPGVIGMNILFGCLGGVGYVIVRYRQNGVLKRFKATPLHAIEFIGAQMLSRFFIVAFMSVIIFAATNFFLHFTMNGSYIDLALVSSLAILCMIALGLLFASRIKSEEVAGGVMNIIIWPMMMLSGIWFSLEGTPKALQTASSFIPITHFVDASRKIMLDGANLAGVGDNILALTLMTILFLGLASFSFKWE